MHGGKGTIRYRFALDPAVFLGDWAYLDHACCRQAFRLVRSGITEVAEIHYVMNGQHRKDIPPGDARKKWPTFTVSMQSRCS